MSLLAKDYDKFEKRSDKYSVEEDQIQRAVKKSIQILYDKGLFHNFPNAERLSKNFVC